MHINIWIKNKSNVDVINGTFNRTENNDRKTRAMPFLLYFVEGEYIVHVKTVTGNPRIADIFGIYRAALSVIALEICGKQSLFEIKFDSSIQSI